MDNDNELRALRSVLRVLEMKVSALESLIVDHPELRERYEALLGEAAAQLIREQSIDLMGSEYLFDYRKPN